MFDAVIIGGARLIVAICAIYILKIYYSIFFKAKTLRGINTCIWVMYFLWQYIMNIELLPSYLKMTINVIIISLICILLYSGNILQKLVFSVLLTTMWVLMEFSVGYIFILLRIDQNVQIILGPISSEVLILLVIVVLRHFFENMVLENIKNNYNIAFMSVPVGSMYILYNIFVIIYEGDIEKRYIIQSLFSMFLILGINIVVFQMYSNLSKEKEKERYNTLFEQQLNISSVHMKELEIMLSDFRNERHDLKQHYSVLSQLLKEAKYKEANDYLDILLDKTFMHESGIFKTGNLLIDAIINSKYSIANSYGITLEADIHIPVELKFANADLTVLLGNILDNAIEAVEKCSNTPKIIQFYMNYSQDFLILTEINKYEGEVLTNRKGEIISRKDNPNSHGMGLVSIKKIASKYKGAVVIHTSENTFRIKVTLCNK